MKTSSFALAALLISAPVLAQTQTTRTQILPLTNSLPRVNSLPFGSAVCRYQQWFAPAQLTPNLKRPVRITGLQFRAASAIGPSSTLTAEVSMANASTLGISGTFASNLGTSPTLVFPRGSLTLARASTGAWTLTVNFSRDFMWDGSSGIVFDVKIFGNSQKKSFIYDFESTVLSKGAVQRVYNTKSATAKTGSFSNGWGLTTRLMYQEGGNYPYGNGCAGASGVVPVGTANRVPLPGDTTWSQTVSKTNPGMTAFFVWGLRNNLWGTVKLPYNTTAIGWKNCWIVAEPTFLIPTKTSGGGAGQATATIVTPIPGLGVLRGLSVFSQWIVFDTRSANGWVSMSRGLHHVIGK